MKHPSVIAKYYGTCPECKSPIVPGENVIYTRGVRGHLQHTDCEDSAEVKRVEFVKYRPELAGRRTA